MTYEEYAKIRDEKGMTDYKVAKLSGIGRSTFSDWKAGRSTPKTDKLMKISEALGIRYDMFIYTENYQKDIENKILSMIETDNAKSDFLDISRFNDDLKNRIKAYYDKLVELQNLEGDL